MNISTEFRKKVRLAVLEARTNYGGTDRDYASKLGINKSIYSRLKGGETEDILSDSQWLTLGRELNVTMKTDSWKVAKTSIYIEVKSNLDFCKTNSKSMILVDECGIGKTFCAKHILRTMKNAFYIDCSQAKTKQLFVRLIAKTLGVDSQGKYADVKANLKYFINLMENPLIVLDEAGDLEYTAFLEVKELWNATTGTCGWYMMGADGLRKKIENGISSKRVGFKEIFSRFSDEYIKIVPVADVQKQQFYINLIGDVATVNTSSQEDVNKLVTKCLKKEGTLRYLETLIKVNQSI
jgi:hypothetical protein